MSLPGYSAGRHYRQAGGGSNYLCLPEEPRWKGHLNSSGAVVGWLFGAEYRMYNFQEVLLSGSNNGGSRAFHGQPAPCAVCYVPHRSAHLMIPASDTCPDGWTRVRRLSHGRERRLGQSQQKLRLCRRSSRSRSWADRTIAGSSLFRQSWMWNSAMFQISQQLGAVVCCVH